MRKCEMWAKVADWRAGHGIPITLFTYSSDFIVSTGRSREGRLLSEGRQHCSGAPAHARLVKAQQPHPRVPMDESQKVVSGEGPSLEAIQV